MIYELQDAGALQGNFKRYIVFNSVWAFLPHNWKWNKYQNWKKYLDLLCNVNLHHIQCLVEISVLEFLFWKKKRKVGIYSISHTGSFLGAYYLFVLISNTDTLDLH